MIKGELIYKKAHMNFTDQLKNIKEKKILG